MRNTEKKVDTAKHSTASTRTTHETGINTVQTLFSQKGVRDMEYILYWFWDYLGEDAATSMLMQMLGVYITHSREGIHTPHVTICSFVSRLIQLCEQMRDVVKDENVGSWEGDLAGADK